MNLEDTFVKKRILVIISFSFSIRYIYRTGFLRKLRTFANPVIGITWNQEDLIKELLAEGFEVHIIPESIKSSNYNNVRKKIDFWFNHFRLKTPSKKIQDTWLDSLSKNNNSLLKKARKLYNIAKFYLPTTIQKLKVQEQQLLLSDTNYNDLSMLVDYLDIETVFTVTPFHTQEDVLLQVCKNKGKQMITSILSFDNITKRGWLPVEYDLYMVWNKYNQAEAKRSYRTSNKELPVTIVGAAQFDFYYSKECLVPRDEWVNQVGLISDDREIILYAGGPQSLFPNEPQYLKHIDEAIRNGDIKGNPIVLFRCHPVDVIQRWKDVIGNSPNIFFDSSWTGRQNLLHANISDKDIAKLCSTLAYTDVHINLCSTMTVDGSVFHKPQIGPAYDEVSPQNASLLLKMYYQEHFVPILNTKGLSLAKSKTELIDLINEALYNPDSMTKASKRIVDEIISYSDGKSTDRLIEAVRKKLLT